MVPLMADQTIFNIAIGICGALGTWWMKAIWGAIRDLKVTDEKLTQSVSDIKVLIAGDYVRREMFDRMSDALFAKLDRIENKLDMKVDK
jgi:hypothetical protein